MKSIPYAHQYIDEEDIAAVVNVLNSEYLTQGPVVELFEKAVADYCGAKYAIAVSSATSALHIACMAAGIGPGEELWTSPNTFVASANCGRYCGADVDFIDIDPRTYNLSVSELRSKLVIAEKNGKLPSIVVPVHFSGQSCDMQPLYALSRQYNFMLIEDASHAIGGSYQNSKIGSCQFSDMTVTSFHPVKIITTGEGGMILTNRDDLYFKLKLLRSHGITRDPQHMTKQPDGPWYYQQIALGYNYRITEIQAALGLSQFGKIGRFVERRNQLAQRYDRKIKEMQLPVVTPFIRDENRSAFHLYVICLQLNMLSKTHLQVFEELREAGVSVNIHYIPVHLQPYYQELGFKRGDFPNAEKYYNEAISLPLFYSLTNAEQDYIITALGRILV